MQRLIVGSISGVFNQLLSHKQTISGRLSYLEGNYLDLNSWFWSEYLDENRLLQHIKVLRLKKEEMPIKIQWAIQNQNTFLKKIKIAKSKLNTSIKNPKELYSYLEVLQIACLIWYYSETFPFKLDICTGFIRSGDSVNDLYENCTFTHSNPYFEFLKENILPLIEKLKPSILWLEGKPSIVTFAIAKMTKNIIPDIHIGVVKHSSEYYSLNKIQDLIIKNKTFFKVFDFIVLEDNCQSMDMIEQALMKNESLSHIYNLIYTPNSGKTIFKTTVKENTYDKNININGNARNYPVDIKLFSSQHCYWNKCTFCGINKKYLTFNNSWNYEEAFTKLYLLNKQNQKEVWCIDEAIPWYSLEKIADKIITEKWDFKWHIRTRIEQELTNQDLCNKLQLAGLKSILLGFESASEEVLTMMNKTDKPQNYLEISEKIVSLFNSKGISVHFPAIIGFPTETYKDRERTIHFLLYLKENYPLFSFNINIFELDISSYIYKEFAKFDISVLRFPCTPSSFIGNNVEWGISNNTELKEIQEKTMKYMFEWYPENSLLHIVDFYRLLEHKREFFWDSMMYEKESHSSALTEKDYLRLNKNVVFWSTPSGNNVIFNTDNFQYIKGGKFIHIVYQCHEWIACKDLLNTIPINLKDRLLVLLQKLVDYKLLLRR